jgi:multidrug efflux pump subunit AcrA (membrane-fusion protein)
MLKKLKIDISKLVQTSILSIALLGQVTAAEQPAKPVKIDVVSKMALAATTELNATLYSRSHIPITAGVNGRLDYVAEPGDLVVKGDVLVKMDLLPLQLLQAEQQAQIN